MIKLCCDRCGALVQPEEITRENGVQSRFWIAYTAWLPSAELCQDCGKAFESWWAAVGLKASVDQ